MALRVVYLGGTRFIGFSAVGELAAAGHDVLVVHRGTSEPDDLADVEHLHVDRKEIAGARDELAAFRPDVVIDGMALGAADTDAVLAAVPGDARLVVLSSADTYRAYGSLHAGTVSDAVPIDETSPVREQRYPYRGQIEGMDDYEKLDVEERYLARGAAVLRLGMVYGPRDGQRREEFVLRRIRSGRSRIPIGTGTALLTHVPVADTARAIRLVTEAAPADVSGEVFNIGERRTPTVALRARWIAEAAGADVEFVRVPDDELPPDLGLTGAIAQHLLFDSAKLRHRLGWEDGDPQEATRRSVEWHLAHPPAGQAGDDAFAADDRALERAVTNDASV